MVSVAASFAVWMQLEELATLNMPAHLYPFPALAGDAVIELAGLSMRSDALIALVSALAVCAALYLTLYRTRFGLGIRATVDLPRGASVVGINVSAVFRRAFVIAAVVGTIGAFVACATAEQLTPKLGMWLTLKAMLAMMIGGLGSLRGAVVAGVALGVLEAHVQRHFGPQLRDASTYLLLFAVLAGRAWRPSAATQFGVGTLGGRAVR
jgi:branched-subunit amino acid ABC-type transport system permease component